MAAAGRGWFRDSGAGGGAGSRRLRRLPADPDGVPLLLRLLAGDPVTAGAVWSLINTADANALRRLHPLIPPTVAAVPWCDTTTLVARSTRWRAAFPAARGARCAIGIEVDDSCEFDDDDDDDNVEDPRLIDIPVYSPVVILPTADAVAGLR